MYLKTTTFFIAFLLLMLSVKIHSQTKIFEALLKDNHSNIEKMTLINSFLKNELTAKKYLNKTAGTDRSVDSVIYILENGDKLKESYNYNDNGNITSFADELWDGKQWTNNERYQIDYDLDGNQTNILVETWDSTQWVNENRYVSEYDLNGKMVADTWEIWDSTNWVTEMKVIYQYDSNGNITFAQSEMSGFKIQTVIEYNSDGEVFSMIQSIYMDEIMLSNSRITSFYNSDKNLIKETVEEMSNNLWVDSRQTTYEYNSNFDLMLWTGMNWNADDSIWINNYHYYYEYNQNNNKILSLYEKWNNSDSLWVSKSRHILQYDLNEKNISDLYEKKDSTLWSNYSNYTYKYNENNNIVSGSYEKWEEGAWIPGTGYFDFNNPRDDEMNFSFEAWRIEEVYYSALTGVTENTALISKYSLSQNYPNPFNPATTINFTVTKSGNYKLVVYNITGQEIKTLINKEFTPGNYIVNFNASDLASGMYIYALTGNNINISRKMILMK